QQLDPGRLSIVAKDDLEIRREDEQDAEETEAGDDERHRRPGKAAVTEVAKVDEGRGLAELPGDKRPEDQCPTDDAAQHPGVGPAVDRLFDDAVDKRSD